MAGKPKQNMVPHLCKCVYVDPATRALAQAAKAAEVATDDQQPQCLSHSASWSHPMHPRTAVSAPCQWAGSLLAFTTPGPSPLPSPLLLATPINLNPEPMPKRKRTSSVYEESPLSGKPLWTPAMQAEFGEDVCRLFIAIRASWNSANNPQMHMFIQKWIPGAIVPD